MSVVNVIVSGPVGSGKSALCLEILAALRAIGVQAEVVGQSSGDVDGDPIRNLEIYRETMKVVVSENLMNERMVSARVGGSYQMPDGREFWVDAPVAQEIARRALGISPSSNDRLGEGMTPPVTTEALAEALSEFQRRNGYHRPEIEELLMEFGELVLATALAALQQVTAERDEARAENDSFRAGLANGAGPCIYCNLSREDWSKCRSGFRGCDRADDAVLCSHFGAEMEANDRADAATSELARLRAEGEAKDRALTSIIEMNVQYAIDRYGDAGRAEEMACVQVARAATAREMALALQGSQTAPVSKGRCAPLRGFALDCPALVGGWAFIGSTDTPERIRRSSLEGAEMSVGGRLIEILPMTLDDGDSVIRLWVVDRQGDETCVYSEPQDVMPELGDDIWWQCGRIYFDRDRQHLKKVGYSFSAPGFRQRLKDEEAEELFQSERISAALATYDFILGDADPTEPDREERVFDAMKAAIQRADHIARTRQTGER